MLGGATFLRKYVLAISVVFVVYGYSANLGLLNYNTEHSWLSFPCAIGGGLGHTISEVSKERNFSIYLDCPKWTTSSWFSLFDIILCRYSLPSH